LKYLNDFGTWTIGIIGTVYTFITGNFGVATWCLLIIMVLDIASGVLKGFKANNLRSFISSLGIAKKGGILLTIIFAFILDTAVNDGQAVFVPMFTWVAIGNESLSFVENMASIGVPIPQAMVDKMGLLKEEYETLTAEKDNQLTFSNKTELKDAGKFDSDRSVEDYEEAVRGDFVNEPQTENNDDVDVVDSLEGKDKGLPQKDVVGKKSDVNEVELGNVEEEGREDKEEGKGKEPKSRSKVQEGTDEEKKDDDDESKAKYNYGAD